jgi:hypothetical protein
MANARYRPNVPVCDGDDTHNVSRVAHAPLRWVTKRNMWRELTGNDQFAQRVALMVAAQRAGRSAYVNGPARAMMPTTVYGRS